MAGGGHACNNPLSSGATFCRLFPRRCKAQEARHSCSRRRVSLQLTWVHHIPHTMLLGLSPCFTLQHSETLDVSREPVQLSRFQEPLFRVLICFRKVDSELPARQITHGESRFPEILSMLPTNLCLQIYNSIFSHWKGVLEK